ncbi:hypothetical protein [Microbispora sp. H10885]|uniref:hypothetical protein n=1 Tax=Microbispora sp. H10885 TaxID=2729110 RepID=UPI0015FEBBA9|nr:hypothetical protein [Microbispora sp. H10885]
MSDQIHLRIGAEPWRPADSAKIDKVLNHYDIPLAGILRQHGSYFIFECLEGHTKDTNIWAYAKIDRAERKAIRKSKGDDLQKLFNHILSSRTFTAALAIDHSVEISAEVRVVQPKAAPAAAAQPVQAPKAAASQAIHIKVDRVQSAGTLAAAC